MAFEYPILIMPGQTAGADFSGTAGGTTAGYNQTGQYLFTKLSGDSAHVPVSNVTDIVSGVAQDHPKSGSALAVMSIGITKVVAGGTLTAGQLCGPNASGQAVSRDEAFSGASYGTTVAGLVLEGASAGELATIRLLDPIQVA